MTRQVAVLVALMVVLSPLGVSQTTVSTPPPSLAGGSTFLMQPFAIPEGFGLRVSSAYSPYDRNADFLYGGIGLTISKMLQLSVVREPAIGTPAGWLTPSTVVGVRLQVIPQREHLPALSLFMNAMTARQQVQLQNVNIQADFPTLYQRGLRYFTYEAQSAWGGLALATEFDEVLACNAALGVRQVTWKQGYGQFSFDTGWPTTEDSRTPPLPERSALQLDWAAGIAVRIVRDVAIIGEFSSAPYIEVDPTSLPAEARQATVAAFGIRYFPSIPVTLELYDRWYSKVLDQTSHHQLRLGLSTQLFFE